MNKELSDIRKQIVKIINNSKIFDPWFLEEHFLVVEKFAKQLCRLYPKANKDVVLLGVWFHDIGKANGKIKNHDIEGANYANKYLSKLDFDKRTIKLVYDVCKSHSCKRFKPQSMEAKILATADAMSHYSGGFYLRLIHKWHDLEYHDAREKLLKKIGKDYKDKLFFKEAKQAIKPLYFAWMTIIKKVNVEK